MWVAVLVEQHDRRNFAIVLAAIEPVAYLFDQAGNRLDATIGGWLESHLDAGVGAVEALEINAPLGGPGETLIGQSCDIGQRLTDRNETLAENLVDVAKADVSVLER